MHTIPGWNMHVKDLYVQARMAFLTWRSAGSPRDGDLATSMKQTRVSFKNALKLCKDNEDHMRAESLAAKLGSKDTISFWAEVRKLPGSKRSLPQNIDEATGDANIAELWKTKYSSVLNSVEDESDRVLLESTLRNLERNTFNLFSVVEVGMAAMKLSANKNTDRFYLRHSSETSSSLTPNYGSPVTTSAIRDRNKTLVIFNLFR